MVEELLFVRRDKQLAHTLGADTVRLAEFVQHAPTLDTSNSLQ